MTVHSRNAWVLALALLAASPFGWRVLASLLLGGGIQIVNLRGLERSVLWLTRTPDQGRPAAGARAFLRLRLGLLLGVVAAVLLAVPVEPFAFVAGLSTVVPAVIWHGLSTARQLG